MNQFDNLVERQTGSEEIFNGKLLHVYRDTVELPNGDEATREMIRHLGAVGIVPITDDGKVILERQFRYPLNSVITEIPAGKLDSLTEDRLSAAKRELREETGITAEEWIGLGEYHPAAAYCDEMITIYIAKGLSRGKQELDKDEFLNIVEVPMEQAVSDVLAGKITDGKTQVALLKAAVYLGLLSIEN